MLPTSFCFLTEWHQYDGVIMKEPESQSVWSKIGTGFSKLVGKYHKHVTDQTTMAVKAMLPSWDDLWSPSINQRNADKLLEKLDQVCFCSRNCFITDDVTPDTAKLNEVSSLCTAL